MRVTVEGNAPGEVLRKLPEIVRHLMELDAGALAEAFAPTPDRDLHDHDLVKSVAPGAVDPNEERFTNPTALAIYQRAKVAIDARQGGLVAAVQQALDA